MASSNEANGAINAAVKTVKKANVDSRTAMEDEAVEDKHEKKGVLYIDTALIPQVPAVEQSEELRDLGVDVFNQLDFEEGVLKQVDEAIHVKEGELVKQKAEKELNTVLDKIRATKKILLNLDNVLATFKKSSKDVSSQQLESIQTQRETKLKKLESLQAKQKKLLQILAGTLFVDFEDGDSQYSDEESSVTASLAMQRAFNQPETEHERLVRLGEMTPFGTTVKTVVKEAVAEGSTKTCLPSTKPSPEMSDFEKFLLEQEEKSRAGRNRSVKKTRDPSKIKKSSTLTSPQDAAGRSFSGKSAEVDLMQSKAAGDRTAYKNSESWQMPSSTLQEREREDVDDRIVAAMDARENKSRLDLNKLGKGGSSKRVGAKSLRLNWGSDSELSDIDNGDGLDEEDGSDYVPDEDEMKRSWMEQDGPYTKITGNEAKSTKKRVVPTIKEKLPKSAHGRTKKVVDDASDDIYFKRLKKSRRDKLARKQSLIEVGETDSEEEEEEDFKFDGGLVIPGKIWHKLYSYQKTGVKWLWELHCQMTGGIIGDEMGLGKTIQIIVFLVALKKSKLRMRGSKYTGLGPVLIVTPTTVLHQWVKEFHKWWPQFRVAILHDSGSFVGSRMSLIQRMVKAEGVLVTSYSQVRIAQEALLRFDWDYVILDEGHSIRNPDAEITLACKQFRTPHRIILSGSPVQNNLRELWSLFDFTFPGKLGTLPVFLAEFSVPITMGGYANASEVQVQTAYKCACILRDTINPYLLRRMKADVQSNIQLPTKNEQVLFCRLSDEQKEVYKEYLDSKECHQILKGDYQVFAGLITLRKICNHPDLSTGGPKAIAGEVADDAELDKEMHYGYWKRSGKMIVVDSLLKLWKKQQHRVLLFSQSRQMLNIMEKFVQYRDYNYMRMDGSTSISARQPLINKFNEDASYFVFLLTTRVGGLGINLTGADRVVIFDPDWNPSTDLQARERAWRIGQDKQVTIYRLLTTGTIEEKIYHRQIFKQFLTNRVLKDPKQRRFFKSNDLFELFTLGSSNSSKHGTETSAIFAGTGSEVVVKGKRSGSRGKALRDEPVPSTSRTEGSSSSMSQMLNSHSGSGKKRRKKSNARLDGKKKIKHLDHQTSYKSGATDNDNKEEEVTKKQDDYVLKKLFKKSGVHSALQHDNIMNSSAPDYLLVEGEAEKVAKKAAQALKRSRQHCLPASAGVPTWTGANRTKLRFGQVTNSKLVGINSTQYQSSSPSSEDTTTSSRKKSEKKQHGKKLFQGKFSGVTRSTGLSSSTSNSLLSSKDLLAEIHDRNRLLEGESSSSSDGDDEAPTASYGDSEQDQLLVELRTFIAFQAHTDGQASTAEILQQFGDKLPKDSTALFKSLLKQICTFHRLSDGGGLWILKPEFR